MKRFRLFLAVLSLLVTSVAAFAQHVTVKGVVMDASNNDPVPFAAIAIKGTTTGVSSDVNGVFAITAPSNSTLVFSSVGYISAEVKVEGKTTINVQLKPDAQALESSVVVGYGSAKKIGTVVGAVTTVKADIVNNAPSSSPLDQLQGQVAGLSVLTSSGVAGDDAVSMTLHGTGSLGSSSEPLFVIDGIPSTSRTIMAMNPNDIVSITVLKDATSISIYGARAANGVVYVTTKSGSYDSKATVTARTMHGVNTLANPQFYKNMMSGDQFIDFKMRAGILTPAQIETNYLSKGYNNNTEWYKYFQNTMAYQYQSDVTIEGGGKKVAYMVSASQYHQDGNTIGNYFDRYTVRSNVQGHPINWLKFGVNASFAIDNKQTNPNWGSFESGTSNYTSGGLSFLLNPLYPAIDPETGKVFTPRFIGLGAYNPEYYMENNKDKYSRYTLNGNAYIEIQPIRNLKITSRVGTDAYVTLNDWYTKPSYLGASGKGTRGLSTTLSHNSTITNTIEYSFNIATEHHISVLAGQEGVNNYYKYYYAESKGQTDDRLLNLQDGLQSTYSMSQNHYASRFLSFFGHADYNYAERYFLDATVRNDASSRFGIDRRNATFWAVGGMWKIANEKFMQDAKQWVNSLDLKVSYGTQGNAAIGNYSHLGLVGTSSKYSEETSKVVAQPANPELTWEQQGLLTVGVAGRFFNMLDVDLSVYSRQTTSMLMAVPYPYTSGFSEVTANVGGLNNTGVDLSISVDILRGKNYYLTFNTIFNYNREKVTDLFEAAYDPETGKSRWEIANTGVAYVVGKPVSLYYPIYAGVDPEDGAPMWYVPGDDIDVTTKQETTKKFDEAALTQNTGYTRHAPFTGGFGLRGAYKGFSFSADFSYVKGKYLINNDAYFYANPFQFATMNTTKSVSDFWTEETPNAKWPDWRKGYVMQFDTHLIEDASFLRLKNLQVAYSFAGLLKNVKAIRDIKLTFTGRNLFTCTKYTGIDPEVDSNLTFGIAGNSRQFMGGIEITF